MMNPDDEGNFGDLIKEPSKIAAEEPTDMELVDEQNDQNENDEVIVLLDNLGTFMDDNDIDTEDFADNETNEFIKYVNTGYDDMKNMYDYIAERISREDENDISPPTAITDIGSVGDYGLVGEDSQLTFFGSPGSTAPIPGTIGTASNENLLESLIEEWMMEGQAPKYSGSVASGTSHTIGTATQSAAMRLQSVTGGPSITI